MNRTIKYTCLTAGAKDINIAVSMGCNVACPSLKAEYFFDFALMDPSGSDDETFKQIIKQSHI